MNSPGIPRPELTVLSGSVTEPRRQTVMPLYYMGGRHTLLALWILTVLFGICMAVWGLS